MQPTTQPRSTRLALVALALLALLGIVAFASRSGFGHQSQAKPTPGYVSYAFSAFLVVFALAIPFTMYAFILQAREGQIARKSFKSRVISNIGTMLFFGFLAFVVIYIKHHHGHLFSVNADALKNARDQLDRRPTHHRAAYEPKFEWTVLWIAIAGIVAGVAWFAYQWRARKRRTAVPRALEATVAEDFAATISDAIDDLEAEPDARRAVIAAYARMERVLARHGLHRRPSETPLEYLRRILLGLTARGEAVRRLTSLFEQAKFSRHEIDEGMKQDAIGALREIRGDLQGATE